MLQFIRSKGAVAALGLAAGVALAGSGNAAFDFGQREYDKHCAACHGAAGKGDGVLRSTLRERPSDLTTLSRRTGGAFPSERVHEKIAGTLEVGRAPREMPCWRAEYAAEATAAYAEEAGREVPASTDLYVETRLAALVDHLRALQAR